MTIASLTAEHHYTADGVQTVFAFGFRIFAKSDVRVIVQDAEGVETVQSLTTHYTIPDADVGNKDGGNITFLVAPGNDFRVTVSRVLPLTQGAALAQSTFLPKTHEDALDRIVMILQRHKALLDRCLKVKESEAGTAAATVIATAADRAGCALAYNEDGTQLEAVLGVPVAVVSDFAEELLDDETAGAMLTTLGVSGYIQTLLAAIDAAAARITLGLVIGTHVQAFDAELAALAGLASAADKLPYFTGAGAAALADLTAFARTLIAAADAPTARTTLGGVNRLIDVVFGPVGNVGATEQVIATIQLPANTLNANKKGARLVADGTGANNASAKTVRIRAGGIGGTIIASLILSPSSARFWHLEALLFRTGVDAQKGNGWGLQASSVGGFVAANNFMRTDSTPALDDGATIDLVVTAEATSNDDIVAQMFSVEGINGA